ncbi:hypothetical protein AHiyo8_61470 [Arthrobacter sp. Hiyo8]|nr:hypothetical protein AHiyo8_61470 [Arthrobacter sp. Hiyo8]
MDRRTAWSADNGAVVQAIAASVAAFASFTRDAGSSETADPLRDRADACLDGLAEVARLEARTAALKARLAADYAQAARAWRRRRPRPGSPPPTSSPWSPSSPVS